MVLLVQLQAVQLLAAAAVAVRQLGNKEATTARVVLAAEQLRRLMARMERLILAAVAVAVTTP
jgi:hypothetical protein